MDNVNRSLWRGALLLTAAGLVVKILSAVYRIPYQNIAGDLGFYVFQQVYPFYAIAAAIAFTGYPMAFSRVVSVHRGSAKEKDVIATSFWSVCALGGLTFILLFSSAPRLALWMGDPALSDPLRVISFLFLVIPFTAFYRGYFQGMGEMVSTAVTQIIEQIVRVSGILIVSYVLVKAGSSAYETGTGALAGSLSGAVISSILLYRYFKTSSTHKLRRTFSFSFSVLKELLRGSIYLSLSAMVLVLMQMADAFSFVNLLTENGYRELPARELKGIFDRGQPLLQLGTVLAASLALALVPEVSALYTAKEHEKVRSLCRLSLKISISFGAAAALGLAVIMEPVNMMLFKNSDGSIELSVLSLSVLFASVIFTATGLLQGLGLYRSAGIAVVAGVFLKVVLNVWLIPIWGMMGAGIATVIATGATAFIQIFLLQRKTAVFTWRSWGLDILKLTAALVLMLLAAILAMEGLTALTGLNHRLEASAAAILSAIIGAGTFFAALLAAKYLRNENMESILEAVPKARKWADSWNKRRQRWQGK
ncbi:polysaccharide biosynthesis protein [Fictibacillus aquaticus]|uniref:polysaccharide biosynthesis protein n=1 Tax=Fictibacillus aquaticus TaxID=2021314 RepID=UPI0013FE25FB|nr:polysaccharide biosynthesis protein [Fictibacillus aquaticus]